MNSEITFYCMRCGKLITFPSRLVGATAFCPHCQQGLVVPKFDPIPSPASFLNEPEPSSMERPVEEASSDSYDQRHDLDSDDGRSRNSVVLIRSFLHPGRSQRLDVGRSLNLDWRRRKTKSNEELDESVFVQAPDLSDDEFIERLRTEAPSYPTARAYVQPPVHIPEKEKTPWRERVNFTKLGIWSGVIVLFISLTALTSFGFVRLVSPRFLDVSIQAPEPVQVDGQILYKTAGGQYEGDEGAFVFLFPTARPFESPLVTHGASPNKKLPLRFDKFLEELDAKGGYFERAGFEGFFDVEVKEPGVYKVLAVSFHVDDDVALADEETLGEIGKYLFKPEEMLERNRFLWTTKKIEGERALLELNVGR